MPTPARPWVIRLVALAVTAVVGSLPVALPHGDARPAEPDAAPSDLQVDQEQVRLTSVPPTGRSSQLRAVDLTADPDVDAALGRSDRRSATRATAPFEAIGITVAEAPEAPVFARGQVAGAWSPWFPIHFDADEGPDAGTEQTRDGVHSEPVWLGGATTYEVEGPNDLGLVTVNLVRGADLARSGATVEPASIPLAGAPPRPAISPRSAWGARPPRTEPTRTGDLRGAVVHHSATANGYSAGQVPAILRSIQAYHQDVQGWDDIAYNFAVDRFGRTWEGRAGSLDAVVLGGHARGFNTGTVGVVVLGDLSTASVPAATAESVARVIAWKLALHQVDPASVAPYTTAGSTTVPAGTTVTLPRVYAHRDVGSTSCPGARLYARLPAIRQRVAALVPSYQGQIPAEVLAPDLDGDDMIDLIEYRRGPFSDVQWRGTGRGTFSRTPLTVGGAYRPAVGDFDGDRRDDVLWHGSGSAADHLWWSRSGGTTSQRVSVNGSYQPVVGDFDGDGRADVVWYSAGLGRDPVWYAQPGRTFTTRWAAQDLISGVPLVGDFDGNGRDDIFWYGPGSASDQLWLGTASRTFAKRAVAVNGRYVPAVLDASGDGRDDVLWFAPGSTPDFRWDFTTSGSYVSRSIAGNVAGTPTAGDFDGDGHDDVLLATPGSGLDAIWYGTVTGVRSRPVTVNGTYAVVAGRTLTSAPASDDALFISSSGADFRWRIGPDRVVGSARIG